MDLSPLGRAALEAREGCSLLAYRDSVGVLTIGYGHTSAAGLPAVKAGMYLSQDEADALFARDVDRYVAAVRAALTRPVPQPFFDACCSLCYNIGEGGFARSSVVRHANAGDLSAAADAFLMWNRPASILGRRQGERDQAALPRYGFVYARRGDKRPVRERPAKAAAAKPPDVQQGMVITTIPSPQKPVPAPPKPAPTGGLSSAAAPAPAPRQSLFAAIAALFRKKET